MPPNTPPSSLCSSPSCWKIRYQASSSSPCFSRLSSSVGLFGFSHGQGITTRRRSSKTVPSLATGCACGTACRLEGSQVLRCRDRQGRRVWLLRRRRRRDRTTPSLYWRCSISKFRTVARRPVLHGYVTVSWPTSMVLRTGQGCRVSSWRGTKPWPPMPRRCCTRRRAGCVCRG